MPISTGRKKLPVTTLLRAIGFETDKDILEIFGLAEDLKVSKASLKKLLAADWRVMSLRLGWKTL